MGTGRTLEARQRILNDGFVFRARPSPVNRCPDRLHPGAPSLLITTGLGGPMNQFRMLTALAMTGLVATVPVAAQGKSGAHGGGAGRRRTVSRPRRVPRATARAAMHARPQCRCGARQDGDHGRAEIPPRVLRSARARRNSRRLVGRRSRRRSPATRAVRAISAMLPSGMTLDQATAGFRNQGQFIAALNASKNQGVPSLTYRRR